MSNELYNLLSTRIQLIVPRLNETLIKLQTPSIQEEGSIFGNNVENIISTLMFPIFLLSGSTIQEQAVKLYLKKEQVLPYAQAYQEIINNIRQIQKLDSPVPIQDVENALVNIISRLPGAKNSMQAVLISAISQMCTAFELLEKYLKSLVEVKYPVLKSAYKTSGMDNKVARIKNAYLSLMPSQELSIIFDNPSLVELFATRDAFLHAGGRVDKKYQDRTGSTLPLSSSLLLDAPTVSRLINAALEAACALLTHTDILMQDNQG